MSKLQFAHLYIKHKGIKYVNILINSLIDLTNFHIRFCLYLNKKKHIMVIFMLMSMLVECYILKFYYYFCDVPN